MDLNDLWAAFEAAKGQTLKINAKVEQVEIPQVESEDESEKVVIDIDDPCQFEEIKKSLNLISQQMKMGEEEQDNEDQSSDDECQEKNMEEEKEDNPSQYKDFRFADVFAKVEDVVNTNEKVKMRDIFKAVEDACQGTNAERVAKKFMRKFKKAHCGGPMKAIMKMLHKAGKKRRGGKRSAEEANMPRFGERHCGRQYEERPEEMKEERKEEPFKYANVLEVLTRELGIDPEKAKAALLKHEGDFDLACSTASKEPAQPAEPKSEKPRDKKWKKRCENREDRQEGQGPCGPWGRGPWGRHGGHHGHHGPHGHGGPFGHGPFGGHGGPAAFFPGMIQQFLNQLNDYGRSSSSDSSEDEKKENKRQPQKPLRPVIVQQYEQLYSLTTDETTLIDITIQNKSKWPLQVDSIKKIEPSDIEFESIEVGQKLAQGEQSKLSIPIKMPSQPGKYQIKLGFFSKKGQTGEVLNLEFDVEGVEASSL